MLMINPKYYLLILFFISWQIHAQTIRQKSENELVVSFISIGSGIDYKATEQLSIFTKDFQHKHHVQLDVALKNWGREGETDYTYTLKKLSKKQRTLFVDKIEALFANNNRVKIIHQSEN